MRRDEGLMKHIGALKEESCPKPEKTESSKCAMDVKSVPQKEYKPLKRDKRDTRESLERKYKGKK